jgi:hypothetical protein
VFFLANSESDRVTVGNTQPELFFAASSCVVDDAFRFEASKAILLKQDDLCQAKASEITHDDKQR